LLFSLKMVKILIEILFHAMIFMKIKKFFVNNLIELSIYESFNF
jgi:hypothetical protein